MRFCYLTVASKLYLYNGANSKNITFHQIFSKSHLSVCYLKIACATHQSAMPPNFPPRCVNYTHTHKHFPHFIKIDSWTLHIYYRHSANIKHMQTPHIIYIYSFVYIKHVSNEKPRKNRSLYIKTLYAVAFNSHFTTFVVGKCALYKERLINGHLRGHYFHRHSRRRTNKFNKFACLALEATAL